MRTGPLSLWLFVVSVASNLLALALPLALLQVYDRILPTSQYGTAVSLFGVVVIAMAPDGLSVQLTSRRISYSDLAAFGLTLAASGGVKVGFSFRCGFPTA